MAGVYLPLEKAPVEPFDREKELNKLLPDQSTAKNKKLVTNSTNAVWAEDDDLNKAKSHARVTNLLLMGG
jgi:hypothetical protein